MTLLQQRWTGSRPGLRRIVRIVVIVAFVLLLLPYLLTPLYLVVRPVSMPMLWRYVTFQPVTRIYRPLDDIAAVLPRTVIASEDAQFCNHRGVDWRGLRDIIKEAEDLDDLRGGSTITQQTAKNLFLWQGRSYVRKALEMPLALWMDLILGKRRIMEIYLNVAEWGPNGQFGAEAGARRAFKTSAADLDAREAALMAAMLPNPKRRDAQKPGPTVRRLSGIYQRRANAAGLDACLKRAPTVRKASQKA
ncbi:MAG: monofunctional biosynthetic peptidoglycan transglycosylase [Pseudomonadota bacterium]